jgi:hypothetical protein
MSPKGFHFILKKRREGKVDGEFGIICRLCLLLIDKDCWAKSVSRIFLRPKCKSRLDEEFNSHCIIYY